jgi:3-oxoacyl-[acyl-carrier protein] reductase
MALQNRVAIVTGAARGIGEATAHVLSGQGAALAVVDIDLDLAEQVAESLCVAGANARAFCCDVSKPSETAQLVQNVVAAFGKVDILVNNAGICPRIPIDEMTEEWFDKIINVNLKSMFFLSRAAADVMKLQKWGRIVNISSTGGRIGGLHRATVYGASKAGVLALSKAMAREYAPFNILVNVIAPGAVDTSMMQMGGEEGLRKYVETVPLKRLAKPLEIAHSIAHLCAEETTWVTGATLDVNGGVVMI